MNLFDNTLRDGGNVVGHGFPADLTVSIVKGLLAAGITDVELGNCKGIGAYEKLGATKALSDQEYLKLLEPYESKGRLGMFLMASVADENVVRMAKDGGLSFLRVGANAGDGAGSVEAVKLVKKAGLTCRYSLIRLMSPHRQSWRRRPKCSRTRAWTKSPSWTPPALCSPRMRRPTSPP